MADHAYIRKKPTTNMQIHVYTARSEPKIKVQRIMVDIILHRKLSIEQYEPH